MGACNQFQIRGHWFELEIHAVPSCLHHLQILVQWLPNVTAIIFVCMLCAYTKACKKARDAGNGPPKDNAFVARINGTARWAKYWVRAFVFLLPCAKSMQLV